MPCSTLLAFALALASPEDALDALLRTSVKEGVVDYAALKPRQAELEAWVAGLAAVDAAGLDRAATQALWINAYNACTLLLMLERYPGIESIKDIPSDERWEAKRWKVAGRTLSLDAMEHEILRPMGDPRVHFALVCASQGCPDLRSEAYIAARLDEQLDEQARRFLANRSKGLAWGDESGFLGTDHVLRVSKIFDWFEEDFEKDGGVVAFVLRFAPEEAAAWIRAHRDDLDVEHLDYDWSLNGR